MNAYIWCDSKIVYNLVRELMENSTEVRSAQFHQDMEDVYAEINADLTHGWLIKKTHPKVSTVDGAKRYFLWKKNLSRKTPFSWMDYCSGEWKFHRVAMANYDRRIQGDRAATDGLDVLPGVDKVFISCEALSNLKARHKEVMELKKRFSTKSD